MIRRQAAGTLIWAPETGGDARPGERLANTPTAQAPPGWAGRKWPEVVVVWAEGVGPGEPGGGAWALRKRGVRRGDRCVVCRWDLVVPALVQPLWASAFHFSHWS